MCNLWYFTIRNILIIIDTSAKYNLINCKHGYRPNWTIEYDRFVAYNRVEQKDLAFPSFKIECIYHPRFPIITQVYEHLFRNGRWIGVRNNSIRKLSRVVALGERAFVCVRNRCLLTTGNSRQDRLIFFNHFSRSLDNRARERRRGKSRTFPVDRFGVEGDTRFERVRKISFDSLPRLISLSHHRG